MTAHTDFVETFADYLRNPARLAFLTPPYEVILPSQPEAVFDAQEDIALYEFGFRTAKGVFGKLRVIPRLDQGIFQISYISSGLPGTWAFTKKQGYGREIIRRTVAYADQTNYDFVQTSSFADGTGSFWYAMGFRGLQPVRPVWLDSDVEAPLWRDRLAQEPDSLWAFARTELGKRALWSAKGPARFALRDNAQRAHVFKQLGL